MLRQSSDLIVVVLAAWLSAILIVALPGIAALRIICSTLLLLVLPGYALSAALLPGRFLDIPQRVLFSLGLSFVVAILGGLILNQFNQPLQLTTWNIVLAVFTAVMALIAAWRRRSSAPLPATETFQFRPSGREVALLALALFVTGAAVQLARQPTPNPNVTGYTLLWLAPTTDNPQQVRVGVESKEFTTTRYLVQIFENGRLLEKWPDLELAPGGSWQTAIELAATPAVTNTIEARLYRSEEPTQVYRYVTYVQTD